MKHLQTILAHSLLRLTAFLPLTLLPAFTSEAATMIESGETKTNTIAVIGQLDSYFSSRARVTR